jgi:hypothetical protein
MLSLAVRRVQADAGSTSTRPGNGEDLRPLPLVERKAKLARLLARPLVGIVCNDHTAEDGPTVFRIACKMGLEGIVSKRLTAPYQSGASRDWVASASSVKRAARPSAGLRRGRMSGMFVPITFLEAESGPYHPQSP